MLRLCRISNELLYINFDFSKATIVSLKIGNKCSNLEYSRGTQKDKFTIFNYKKNFTKRELSENVVEIIFQFLIHYYDKAAWLATVSF